jgi:hypothetical protein
VLQKRAVEAQANIGSNDSFTASCAMGHSLPPLRGLR